jgi:hypothetical protein
MRSVVIYFQVCTWQSLSLWEMNIWREWRETSFFINGILFIIYIICNSQPSVPHISPKQAAVKDNGTKMFILERQSRKKDRLFVYFENRHRGVQKNLYNFAFLPNSASQGKHVNKKIYIYIPVGESTPEKSIDFYLYEILGSHVGEYEDGCLLGCCAV